MIGTTLAHYRVLSLLGRGGMGEVYLAENLRLKKQVALKFLSPELNRDTTALQRLQREATAAAELDHPNIARILDMQEVEGRHFLVMEYVKGETLANRLAVRGKLAPEETRRIIRGIAAGLEHAHGKGIVHRDIKSANVMLTPDGGVKILDLGLAQHRDVTRLTQPGSIIGTLSYMSPEQVRGAPVDERTDLWSLGVILHECLTGDRPFDGPSSEATIHNILNAHPRPISQLNRDLPPGMEGVLTRLLEKDPTRRYTRARDVVRDLGPSSSSARTVAWAPRSNRMGRWVRLAAIAAIVVVAAMAGIRWWGNGTGSSSGPPRLAVVPLSNLDAGADSLVAAGLTLLLQVGLADAEGCEMVAPEYLRDVQRRHFGSGLGAIPADQALQVVKDAGATHMISGEVIPGSNKTQIVWRITDVKKGKVVGTGMEEAASAPALADKVASAAMVKLSDLTRSQELTVVGSVADRVTADPEAYRHYVAGMVAAESFRNTEARLEFQRAVEIDSTFALAWFGLCRTYHIDREREKMLNALQQAQRYRSQLGERDRLLLEAWDLHQSYKVADALAIYDRILDRWPDSREALSARAYHLLVFQDFSAVREAAVAALKIYPEDTNLLRLLCNSLFMVGTPEEQLEVCRKGRRLESGSADWLSFMVTAYLLRADPDSAEVSLREGMSIEPGLYSGWQADQVWIAYARAHLDDAIERGAGMAVGPTAVSGQFLLLADAGRIAEARRIAGGDSLFGRMCRFTVSSHARLWDAAVSIANETAPTDLRLASLYFEWCRACAQARLEIVEPALAVYGELVQAMEREPNIPRGWIRRQLELAALLALARGEPDSALIFCEEWQDRDNYLLDAEGMRLSEFKAEAQAESGDLEGAIGTLEKELRVCASRTLGHYQLACYYEQVGRVDAACKSYRRCLELWRDADADYPYPAMARERLARLKVAQSD